MSLCPPFAPFFGFAGVASAVGCYIIPYFEKINLNYYRWSLAVSFLADIELSLYDSYLILAVGAAFGTSKAGIGIAGLGTFKPELIMKVRSSSS
jgi:V-type H+-transporting ATPase proteolipid subunit